MGPGYVWNVTHHPFQKDNRMVKIRTGFISNSASSTFIIGNELDH